MYKTHIVAFIDILGFKELLEKKSFADVNIIYEEFNKMGQQIDIRFREMIWHYKNALGIVVPERFTFAADKTKIIFFSDCVVWSYCLEEITREHHWYVVHQLISVINLLYSVLIFKGILIRGGISMEKLFIDGKKVFGPGLVRSYELEKMATYPQIVCDCSIFEDEDLPSHPEHMKKLVFDLVTKDLKSGFYSIDHFKMIEHVARVSNTSLEKGAAISDFGLVEMYVKPIVDIIPKGINHTEERVWKKYSWLREKLLSLKNVDYDLSILNTKEFIRN